MVKNGRSAASLAEGSNAGGESETRGGTSSVAGETSYASWLGDMRFAESANGVNMACDEVGESSEVE